MENYIYLDEEPFFIEYENYIEIEINNNKGD